MRGLSFLCYLIGFLILLLLFIGGVSGYMQAISN